MTRRAPGQEQKGVALWMLLIALVMTGGYAFYRTANTQFTRTQQDNKLALTMARAKEALIAYAVTDSDRPGSLPCPDLGTDSAGLNNFPGDGKADMLAGNQCPIYVGWLPWVMPLDLPELTDNTGTRLWYVLAPGLRNDDSAQPINSDTATGLLVDGSSEIAAILIAPRAPLAGQNRPSNNPGDYLEGENGNGNDHKYVTGPQGDAFNDLVLVITRQELMAAVEKRVANETRNCLEQHASSAANPGQRYPWPAPFSASGRQGKAGSLFGRIPTSQPGSGPEAALKNSITRLTMTRNQISSATDANLQLVALNNLGAELVLARNLFEAIYLASNQLKQTADEIISQIQSLEKAIKNAITTTGGITQNNTIRTLTSALEAALNSLPTLLSQFGIDVFPWELTHRRSSLGNASTAATLLVETQAIRDLLLATTTPRTDIDPNLSVARNAALLAYDSASLAASTPTDTGLLNTAQSTAKILLATLIDLQASVEASRVSILSSEVTDFIAPLDSRNVALRNAPTPENIAPLLTTLSAIKTSIEQIATGVNGVILARNTAVAALEAAQLAAQATFPDYSLIDGNTTTANGALKALALAIAANEAIDNNVGHTSLSAAINAYNSASNAFTLIDTTSPRPIQTSIAPYAVNLGNAAVNIDLWAKIVSANASAVAPIAKAVTVSANVDPATASALDTSAYQTAANALASISASNTALQAYIANPSADNQATAITKLAQTTSLVNTLMDIATALDTQLSATTASAQAMIWASAACDFLRTGQNSWWNDNQWANSIFYQIAGPLKSTAGNLTVNAAGSYRLVVLAAGKAFAGQNRGTPASAQFFEGINADASRDGDATIPLPGFVALPPSATFNDRLAY